MCDICGNPRSKHLVHWTQVAEKYPKSIDRFNKELDMMPDGIHAKLYKNWAFNKKNLNESFLSGSRSAVTRPSETKEQTLSAAQALRQEWVELPDPKPDFFEWGADKCKPEALNMLRDVALNGRRVSDRIKAIDILLKHGKVPPKQILEVNNGQEAVDLDQLLLKICEVKGIPVEAIRPFLTLQ